MLIGSDNAAARVLAKTSPLGYDGFISRMNEKAREYGLKSTTYVDPARDLRRQRVERLRHGEAHHHRVGHRAHGGDHAHVVGTRSAAAAAPSP